MADTLINLPEFAKGINEPVRGAMIRQFAEGTDVFQALPFKTVRQGRNVFERETALPAVGFRAVNQEPEISHGGSEEFQDICAPISGLIEFDRIKLKRYGEEKKAQAMLGQMTSAARVWSDVMINGSQASNIRHFNGLKARCLAVGSGTTSVDGSNTESRLIANSVASGGGAPSLSMLDLALSLVANPTHIIMPRKLRTRLIAASRNTSVSGFVVHQEQEQGKMVTRYGADGLPILVGYPVSKDDGFLPFTEVGYGGGAAQTSSIYVVSMRMDGLCGIQTSAPEYEPVDTDRGVFKRDLFEWDAGITVEDRYSIIRLSSVTDAAWVA